MGGPGMMMGAPMMDWGHMRGYYSNLTPEQLKQRQYMMEQYLPMQQMMMNHMMDLTPLHGRFGTGFSSGGGVLGRRVIHRRRGACHASADGG